jgi:predicted DNA-binding ribbon-helix-helix protein
MTKGFKSPNVHNVWLKGRCTSISVEPDFWEQFRLIVIERRTTISNLLTEIERTMRLLPDQGKGCDRTLTLSAAVRVFVLRTVMSQSSSRRGAPRQIPHGERDFPLLPPGRMLLPMSPAYPPYSDVLDRRGLCLQERSRQRLSVGMGCASAPVSKIL